MKLYHGTNFECVEDIMINGIKANNYFNGNEYCVCFSVNKKEAERYARHHPYKGTISKPVIIEVEVSEDLVLRILNVVDDCGIVKNHVWTKSIPANLIIKVEVLENEN